MQFSKTSLVLALVLYSSIQINAQLIEGKAQLKGSSAFTGQFLTETYKLGSSSATEYESVQYNFQPALGIFATRFFHVGLYTGYAYKKESTDDSYNKMASFVVGPYVRVFLTTKNCHPSYMPT